VITKVEQTDGNTYSQLPISGYQFPKYAKNKLTDIANNLYMATLDTLMKTGWGDSRTRNLLVGSCEISDACNSSLTDPFLGNDICNDYDPYNTEECCWDGGDCVKVFGDCNATHETCAGDISLLGDGYCDANNKNDWYTGYNTEGCCWDGGDCSRPKPEGLEGVGTFVFVALSFTLCTLFRAKLHSNRRNAAATNAGPTPRPVVEQASLSAAEDRRQLILMSIIHKVNYLEQLIFISHNHLHCKILIKRSSFLRAESQIQE